MFKLTKTILVSFGSQSRRMFSSYETLSVTTPKVIKNYDIIY